MNLEDIDYITGDIGNPFNAPTHIKVKLKNGLHESELSSYAIELSKSIVKSHLRNVKINDIIDEKED